MNPLFNRLTPCGSCPYRKCSTAARWAVEEFQDLLEHDRSELGRLYQCHQKDGHSCVGWLLDQRRRNLPSIALRLALIKATDVPQQYIESLHSEAPLFDSVEEMCQANYPETFVEVTLHR